MKMYASTMSRENEDVKDPSAMRVERTASLTFYCLLPSLISYDQ